mgnify:CR=1 FL=1
MGFLAGLSEWCIPLVFFYVVLTGMMEHVAVYDVFVKGAKEGLKTTVQILPTLIGLMAGVGILRASGFLDALSGWLAVPATFLHFPKELVPLTLVRMFSSSAATGLLLDVFQNYGTDSLIGWTASILMSCTETIFYTMSVYFLAAGIRKTRFTLPGALLATTVGAIASVMLAMRMIG